jgi:hypothetical protein
MPTIMAYSLADILGNTALLQPTPRQQGRERVASARSRNRGAAWAYDLAQWRQYRLSLARSEAEHASIEAEYEERVAAGPDFCTYREGSDFTEPHRHQLSAADKWATLHAFDSVRDWLYRNARKAHGQGVSLVYRKVLEFLLSLGVKHGTVYPALATIAAAVGCNPRTVSNALRWLKLWGFLDWHRRIKRVATRLGSVSRQTSNAYVLVLKGLAAIGVAIFSKTDGNHCSPSDQKPPPQPITSPFRLV